MKAKIKKILGVGLSGGYGSSNYGKITRAGSALDSSDYQGPEGRYHDEWAAHQNGGGQELAEDADGENDRFSIGQKQALHNKHESDCWQDQFGNYI